MLKLRVYLHQDAVATDRIMTSLMSEEERWSFKSWKDAIGNRSRQRFLCDFLTAYDTGFKAGEFMDRSTSEVHHSTLFGLLSSVFLLLLKLVQ